MTKKIYPELVMVEVLNGMLPYVISMGSIAIMNRVSVQKKAFFENEIKEDYIKNAKIMIIPIHWFYSITIAKRKAEEYKKINKNLVIITGGYSATLFDIEIIDNSVFDIIVRGDAELPFSELIKRILKKEDYSDIPNLTTKKFQTNTEYKIDPREYSNNDYINIDWFPSLKNVAYKLQASEDISYVYPWVSVMKGCIYNCSNCLASKKNQKILFNREVIFRSSAKIKEDLLTLSSNRKIAFCYFNSDFINMFPEDDTLNILGDNYYDIHCYYEWYQIPEISQIALLENSFKKISIGLFYSINSECVNDKISTSSEGKIINIFKYAEKRKKINIILYIDKKNIRADKDFKKSLKMLLKFRNIQFRNIDENIIPRDFDIINNKKNIYSYFIKKSVSEIPSIKNVHFILKPVFKYFPFLISILYRISTLKFKICLKYF